MSELRDVCAVIGAQGMLGTDLVRLLRESGVETVGLDVEHVDITRRESLSAALGRHMPDRIINVAALTDVDGCETRQEEAFMVNAQGAANLARLSAETGAFLLHVSTDYVFDGQQSVPYKETDRISPVGVYGKSKAQGEMWVRELLPTDHCIVRTQWLYGHHGKNFVEAILDAAQKRDVLKVVNDQHGSPTYALDLAEALVKICSTRSRGTVHVTNSGQATWYDFAAAIVEFQGILNVRVEPISTEELGRPAPRPAYSVLDNSRFVELVGEALRDWRDALADYLAERSRRIDSTAGRSHS